MHTEEQARKLWCPEKPAHWQSSTDASLSRCQASGCMMWRWAETDEVFLNRIKTEGPMHDVLKRRGFCGLAGRP